MKKCPVCNQTYTDDSLNFCLTDGGILTKMKDDPPPTVFMNKARPTNETNWSNPEPFTSWQNQPVAQNTPFMTPSVMQIQNQTLPTISLILGIAGLLLTFCCMGGFPFNIAALVTGFLGFKNANQDPMQYGGRGLAIAGMILGAISIVILIFIIIFAVLANM